MISKKKTFEEQYDIIITLLTNMKLGYQFDKNALAKIADLERKSTIDILRLVLKHASPDMRARASEVLLKLDSGSSQEFVLPLLKDDNKDVRYIVADLLSFFGDSRAVDLLLNVAKSDSDVDVRCNAIMALGAIGSKRATSLLEYIASNDFERDFQGDTVSSFAKKALDMLNNLTT